MKKPLRKAFAALAAALICFAGAAPAFADYGYTVRIFAGNQGSIDGQNVKVLEDLEPGEYQFNSNDVYVNNSEKYFVKGVRLSGRDNTEFSDTMLVDRDADYVVAYGIRGSEVSFTLIMQASDTGRELGRKTIYGSYGDQALVKTPYVEGYRAQANYVRKTLTEDSEFVLLYYPAAAHGGNGGAGGQGAGNDNPGGDNVPGGQTGPGGQGAGGQGQQGGPGGETIEIIDIDPPLSDTTDIEYSNLRNRSALPPWAVIGGAAGIGGLVGINFWLLLFYRKKKHHVPVE